MGTVLQPCSMGADWCMGVGGCCVPGPCLLGLVLVVDNSLEVLKWGVLTVTQVGSPLMLY